MATIQRDINSFTATIERNGTALNVTVERTTTPINVTFTRKSGEDGLSAYEIAVDNGFAGTEEQWLESLVAPTVIFSATEPVSPAAGTIWFQI